MGLSQGGGGGSASPGGSDNQGQYNNSGALGGMSGSTYNESSNRPVFPNGTEFTDGANTMVVDGTPTGARTITLPDATDTLVGKATTDTFTNKTLTAPTITGAVVHTGATTHTTTSSDGKVVVVDAVGSLETSNATPAAAYTSGTLIDEAVHSIEVIVTAITSDGTAAAVYKRHYAGRRDGGTFTALAVYSDDKTEETNSAWDCTVDVSSNTFRVMVTGVAATTIRWGYAIRTQSTVP